MTIKLDEHHFKKNINGIEESFVSYRFDVVYNPWEDTLGDARKKQKEWLLNLCIRNERLRMKYLAFGFETMLQPTKKVRDYYGYWKQEKRTDAFDYFRNLQEGKIQKEGEDAFWGTAEFDIQEIGKALDFITKRQEAIILGSKNGVDIHSITKLLSVDNYGMLEVREESRLEWIVGENGVIIGYNTDGDGELIYVTVRE